MIKTFITHEKIITGQEKLQSFLDESEGQIDWQPYINEAKQDLINDLISSGYMVRQLNVPLVLQEETTEAGTKTGEQTKEDIVQRQVLWFNASSVNDNVFVLQGSSDGTTWNDIIEFSVTETGERVLYLDSLYKYYRLNKEDTNSCTYEASLYERIYETLHLYKTRAKIYNSLVSTPDDVYSQLRDYFEMMYDKVMEQTRFKYDEDDSGEISEDEAEKNYNIYDISL
jgi:hypothetical protein